MKAALSALILFCLWAVPPTAVASHEWKTATPQSANVDTAALESLALQIQAGDYSDIHSLLLIRHNRLVFERYFVGADERRDTEVGSRPVGIVRFEPGTLHDMRSISKSVVSMLFGIAQSQGLIGDLNQSALSFFPEYADLRTEDRKAIELRHLLSMTPGLEWDEDSKPYGDAVNSETAMDHAADPYRYVLERRIVAQPGEKFVYNGGTTLLLGRIIERAVKMPIDRYAQKVLFQPLGITQFEWLHYPSGTAIPASGLRLRPRDLAKLAELYLQRGHWKGKTLVPESWVQNSTSPQAPGGFYGLHWWTGSGSTSLSAPASEPWFMAVGYGGQRALISPTQDLIVVVTAGLYNDRRQSEVVNKILRRCTEAAR